MTSQSHDQPADKINVVIKIGRKVCQQKLETPLDHQSEQDL